MLEEPEFEEAWYAEQNKKMAARYGVLFQRWKLSWNKYFTHVQERLRYNEYWIWVYLCGFEKFVQEQAGTRTGLRKRLEKDQDERIRRIVGDFYKIQDYIKTL